jgi:hypothetical protein
MSMNREIEIKKQIEEFVGMERGYINGTAVYFTVKEMYGKVGSSVWRREPMGRYQINVPSAFGNRDKIFRMKKDGSFDLLAISDAIKAYYSYRKNQDAMMAAREYNRSEAERIRTEAKAGGLKKYLSSYGAAHGSSFVTPASTEGLVEVQINFGSITPEQARKVLAFVQSMEA